MKLWRREVEAETVLQVPTLGLGAALSLLPRHRPARVLDLGPANGQNVTFFSRFGCQLEIFDLYSSITDYRNQGFGSTSRTPSPVHAAVDSFLERAESREQQPGSESSFDLILAWDLLDYISGPEIAELFRGLRPHRRAGTRLLAFVSYRGPIPGRPRRYQIADEKSLAFDEGAGASRPCPGYKEPQLLKLLPGFEVESCYLMRHGVQEYVFLERGREGG